MVLKHFIKFFLLLMSTCTMYFVMCLYLYLLHSSQGCINIPLYVPLTRWPKNVRYLVWDKPIYLFLYAALLMKKILSITLISCIILIQQLISFFYSTLKHYLKSQKCQVFSTCILSNIGFKKLMIYESRL